MIVYEAVFGLRDIGVRVTDVTGAGVVVDGIGVGVKEVVERVDEFVNRDAVTTADVERFPSHVSFRGEDVRLDGVVDEGKVTRLLAVTIDDGPVTVKQ